MSLIASLHFLMTAKMQPKNTDHNQAQANNTSDVNRLTQQHYPHNYYLYRLDNSLHHIKQWR